MDHDYFYIWVYSRQKPRFSKSITGGAGAGCPGTGGGNGTMHRQVWFAAPAGSQEQSSPGTSQLAAQLAGSTTGNSNIAGGGGSSVASKFTNNSYGFQLPEVINSKFSFNLLLSTVWSNYNWSNLDTLQTCCLGKGKASPHIPFQLNPVCGASKVWIRRA